MSAAADLWRRYDLAVPVDLRRLVDDLGLEVVYFPFRGRIREMIVDGVIGVQPGLPRPWFRWYVAHAIGHHLMHLGTSFYLDGWQWVSHAKTEHQAEEFAAWLLTGADGGHCSAAELGIPAEKAHLVRRCPSRALKNSFDYRSGALSSEEREEIVSEGHPQTPGKGA